MIGKRIRISDYKFTYGQEVIYINVFGAFKNKKDGSKYIVYSYDNKKVYCGSFFVNNNMGTIMISKDMNEDIINDFIEDILSNKKSNKYEIFNLDEINSIQIIDEMVLDSVVDINKLYEITIPVEKVTKEVSNKKNKFPFTIVFIIFLFVVIGIFMFINPQIIYGKNKNYICNKEYSHKELPSNVIENISISFDGRGNLLSLNIIDDYVFTDVNYYNEFKNKNYFYKYIEEGDTYKFDDSIYTYRVFRSVDVTNDFFLPNSEEDLLVYYRNNGYDCNEKEE